MEDLKNIIPSANEDEEAFSEQTKEAQATEVDEEDSRKEYTEKDYGELEKSDIAELKSAFPELRELDSITELKNPLRYGALRDLGLTPIEAYLASEGIKRRPVYNNRSHLSGSVPTQSYSSYIGMTRAELDGAKEIFSDLSDAEIQKLYKKVTR